MEEIGTRLIDATLMIAEGLKPKIGKSMVGIISSDKKRRFVDGTLVHTTKVLSVDTDGEDWIVKTLNTTYLVKGIM